MKSTKWMRFISARWFSTGASSGASLVPAASGIAVGVCALIVIISIMNGFQMGFIEAVLELDGYHIRLESPRKGEMDAILALQGVKSVLPFTDTFTLALNDDGASASVKIKSIPANAGDLDRSLPMNLALEKEGLSDTGGIIIGSELARKLDCGIGDFVSILSIASSEEEGLTSGLVPTLVTDIFHCGYLDFDEGLIYSPVPDGSSGGIADFEVLGIKLQDRYADAQVMRSMQELGIGEERIESWRSYNQAFFGALRMEKTIMMMLVGLIFLVVGVNIFHAMRKAVFERIDEIAILKTIGGEIQSIRSVFVINGLLAGVGGSFCGLLAGLLITQNINNIFKTVESISAFLASLIDKQGFSFFSSSLFYIAEVPVRPVFLEIVFIVVTGAFSAVIAAWVASERVARFKPSEVLRHE